MESWRQVWRDGLVPCLSNEAIAALHDALIGDDPRLTQGSSTTPPPMLCVHDWPCEGGDALAFAVWQGDGKATVGAVHEAWADLCFQADNRLGEPAACRWFLNWFDDTPRDQMRRELLQEVELALSQRHQVEAPAPAKAHEIAAA